MYPTERARRRDVSAALTAAQPFAGIFRRLTPKRERVSAVPMVGA